VLSIQKQQLLSTTSNNKNSLYYNISLFYSLSLSLFPHTVFHLLNELFIFGGLGLKIKEERKKMRKN
jgi:hypothetical protein